MPNLVFLQLLYGHLMQIFIYFVQDKYMWMLSLLGYFPDKWGSFLPFRSEPIFWIQTEQKCKFWKIDPAFGEIYWYLKWPKVPSEFSHTWTHVVILRIDISVSFSWKCKNILVSILKWVKPLFFQLNFSLTK